MHPIFRFSHHRPLDNDDPFLSLEDLLQNWAGTMDTTTQIIPVENGVEIHMVVPGIDPESLSVEVEHGILKVAAAQAKEAKHTFFRDGLSRSWKLPETVNLDGITATCKNGILTVAVPVDDAHKKMSKKIPITA